jgi:hypothetical protein
MRVVLFLAWAGFGICQLAACIAGLGVAFGVGGLVSFLIFVALSATGFFGGIVTGGFAFYGAWKGWNWPPLVAGLLPIPFLLLQFAVAEFGTALRLFRRVGTPLRETVPEVMPLPTDSEGAARRDFAARLQKTISDRGLSWQIGTDGHAGVILKIATTKGTEQDLEHLLASASVRTQLLELGFTTVWVTNASGLTVSRDLEI